MHHSYSSASCVLSKHHGMLFCLHVDIDECREAALNNSVICTQNDTVCQNTPGNYECVCVPGYRMMNGVCQREHN